MPKKTKKRSKTRAIGINIAKWAFVAYSLSVAGEGMGQVFRGEARDWHQIFRQPLENLLNNWKILLPVGLAITVFSKLLGRWMPRAGVPGLVSVKPL